MASVFQSWQNQNRYRTYPFRDDATLSTDEDPGIRLPNDFIIDFSIVVPVDDNTQNLDIRLSAMFLAYPMLTLFFSIGPRQSNSNDTVIATASVQNLEDVGSSGLSFSGSGYDYDDVRGSIVFGNLDSLKNNVPDGSYHFSNALFEISTVRPALRGVRSIRVGTGTVETNPLYGAVKLIEGNNVKLDVRNSDSLTPSIIINAVSSNNFEEKCECETNENNVIKFINGLSANDVSLVPGDCIDIELVGSEIKITDKCSKPCCGCTELDFILGRLKYVEEGLRRLNKYAETMNSIIPTSLSAANMAVSMNGSLDLAAAVKV